MQVSPGKIAYLFYVQADEERRETMEGKSNLPPFTPLVRSSIPSFCFLSIKSTSE